MKQKKITENRQQRGIEPEFQFHPERLKRVPREKIKLARPEDMTARNIKLRIAIRLDADIVRYFKRRAKKPFAAPYQTQINEVLRQYMEQNPKGE